MTPDEIVSRLEQLGCPPQKCEVMARQLDRKARMDSARQQISHGAALEHLLALMAQGWVTTSPASAGGVSSQSRQHS